MSRLSVAHRCLQFTLLVGVASWFVLRTYLPALRVASLSALELTEILLALGLPGAYSLIDVYRRHPERRRWAGRLCLAAGAGLVGLAFTLAQPLAFLISIASLVSLAACLATPWLLRRLSADDPSCRTPPNS